jgi:hypothetical protein
VLPLANSCLICNAPLSFHQALTGNLCGKQECRWKQLTLPKQPACAVCGRPLSLHELAAKVCVAPNCQLAFFGEQARERQRLRLEALNEQALKLRDWGAQGVTAPASFPLTVIPSFDVPVTNLPQRRRDALRDHVTRLLSQATVGRRAPPAAGEGTGAAPQTSAAPAPAVQAVLGRACAQCKGFCCRDGGDYAYLTVDTLRRYLAAHPEQRPREVLAAYLACLGNKTSLGSCVYHGPQGCTLPREMRSDTCNDFFCPELRGFQNGLPGTGPVQGFFVSANDGGIRAAAFIDEEETRTVEVPAD